MPRRYHADEFHALCRIHYFRQNAFGLTSEIENQYHNFEGGRMTPITASRTPSRTLADLPSGQGARILEVFEPGPSGERLLEMGLTPGTVITVVRRGICGDPLQIALRGYMLSLRRLQAEQIAVAIG